MAICKKCGADIPDDAVTCHACGAPVEQTEKKDVKDEAKKLADSIINTSETKCDNKDAEENKGISILCYLGLLLLIPLLTKPNSQFVKFHSNQGLLLLLFCIAASLVMVIPILGWIVGLVAYIFIFVCWIMGILNVVNGKCKDLPLIGKLRLIK